MVKRLMCVALLAAALLVRGAMAAERPKVEFKDGDRIVFLGNEFFEREADRGYIEAALTTRFPDKNLTFRNLGYSGDTVRADARNLCSGWAVFGPADQGFDRLKNLIEHIKPTLIFVAYGMNESFEGPKGLDAFVQGLGRMLDMLASNSAPGVRIVLISPIRHEDLGRPLPDPTEHNKDIALYTDAMDKAAKQRGYPFINLFKELGDWKVDNFRTPFTSDGIHLTAYGYWRAAIVMDRDINGPRNVEVTNPAPLNAHLQFTAAVSVLPYAPAPEGSPKSLLGGRTVQPSQAEEIRVRGLPAGTYDATCDGKPVARFTAEQWERGIMTFALPDVDQEEKLRHLVVAKNFDFFNFWRPDNDTYIFGYRKHEQGRNAVEIPRFEPLVAAKEAEIARLRVPQPHEYMLSRQATK